MFYETSKNDHGLPRDPFKAIVSPRPVGWITSMNSKGEINLAPTRSSTRYRMVRRS
jgi:flavin reductase (DIM6/NTAB) family NADH-FMN oxidoreductase RutF